MTGHIQKRGENTWRLHIFVGRDPVDNKPIYQNRTFHGPKKEAERLLRELVRDYELGRVTEPSRQSLSEFLDQWLEKAARQKVRARTLQDYRNLVRCYIRDTIGFVPLGKLTPMQIQSLYSALSDGVSPRSGVAAREPLSPRTIRNLHFTVKQALQQSYSQIWCMRNSLGSSPTGVSLLSFLGSFMPVVKLYSLDDLG